MPWKERLHYGEIENFSPAETLHLLKSGEAIVIDVRSAAEFANESIEGSVLIPLPEFGPASLPPQNGKLIVLSCASGIRSRAAADRLLEAGHGRLGHLDGGIVAWRRAGLPVIL